MKIKNTTDSVRQCWNKRTGWKVLVGPGEIIEIEKVLFDPKAFKIIYDKKSKKTEKQEPKILGANKVNRRKKKNGVRHVFRNKSS